MILQYDRFSSRLRRDPSESCGLTLTVRCSHDVDGEERYLNYDDHHVSDAVFVLLRRPGCRRQGGQVVTKVSLFVYQPLESVALAVSYIF